MANCIFNLKLKIITVSFFSGVILFSLSELFELLKFISEFEFEIVFVMRSQYNSIERLESSFPGTLYWGSRFYNK